MKTRLSAKAVNIEARALAEGLNGGYFDVMTGDPPEDEEPTSEELRLASCPLASTAFAAPKDGLLKANPIAKTIAVRSGEPTWFRLRDREGDTLIEGSRSQMGLKVNMLVEGQTVSITEFTHRIVKEFA